MNKEIASLWFRVSCFSDKKNTCSHIPLIHMLQYNSTETPYGNCVDLELDYFSRYSTQSCQIECLSKMIIEHCNCSYIAYPPYGKFLILLLMVDQIIIVVIKFEPIHITKTFIFSMYMFSRWSFSNMWSIGDGSMCFTCVQ